MVVEEEVSPLLKVAWPAYDDVAPTFRLPPTPTPLEVLVGRVVNCILYKFMVNNINPVNYDEMTKKVDSFKRKTYKLTEKYFEF